MTYHIEWQNHDNYPVNTRRIRAAAETVLTAHSMQEDSTLTVVITDNQAVRELNLHHRDIDAGTDILSFPADAPPIKIPGEAPYLGDLIIAYPYALQQAQHEKIAVDDSFVLLVIHGVLHLLGYDHDTDENRTNMWNRQETMLRKMGVSPGIVPILED